MFLPAENFLLELVCGFALVGFLKLVDFGDDGLHPLEFALVLIANDFLQGPFDHVR